MSMMHQEPKATYLKDYRKPDYLIPEVSLDFELGEESTKVHSALTIQANPAGQAGAPLSLNGERLKLVSVKLDGRELQPADYQLNETHLTIPSVPKSFKLEITTEIKPQENKALEGLYKSGDIFCTQNESEGFRKITYFLDRPDVMSRYVTKIRADKKRYPVLLSNGDCIEKGDLPDGRHFTVWRNPFAMPCYLYALVAGDLGKVEDSFTTKSRRKISLQIYVDKGNESRTGHAMESLKKAMCWDEEVFGLEYDLDTYMIVAVDAFNFGAMENKGLNIFNSQYILADPKTATDQNYEAVQSVVAHEYFHNWTGNRVTCRDWFQITLKEGLTVFREQEFTADMTSRAVKRINDARAIRDRQFPEDSGPNAHPIRPESYIEINNFYTPTVYEKGAEVIRMIQTLIGRENFVKGIKKYFELYDGQAVTTEDFVHAMEVVSGMDLTQFKNWYSQAGTPTCKVHSKYDASAKALELNVSQEPGGGPPEVKKPYFFPLVTGMLDSKGREMLMPDQGLLKVSKPAETFRIPNAAEKPVLSLLRNFSAPVKLVTDQTKEDQLFLLAYDSDSFNRYEAGQRLAAGAIADLVAAIQQKKTPVVDEKVLNAFGKVLEDSTLDLSFLAEILTMPSTVSLLQGMSVYDFDAVFQARETFLAGMAQAHEPKFSALYRKLHQTGNYRPDRESIGRRLVKNRALGYLLYVSSPEYGQWAAKQFFGADNMTDEIYALSLLCQTRMPERDKAVQAFYDKWQKEPLVMNKWFGVQADSKLPGTIEIVKALEKSPAYDGKNPNKIRALFGVFSGNLVNFHAVDGKGYALLAEKILEIDRFNPSAAAHLAGGYKYYSRVDATRKKLLKDQMEFILKAQGLSPNTYEIISKTLASGA